MQRKTIPIEALLLRTFLPAVVVVAMVLAVLVYNWLYSSILDGFERKLVTTSALTGAMIDPEDHDWLIDAALKGADAEKVEAMPVYERNAAPIRRIRKELGLTYLYSQVIGGPSDILYILDGSEGDDHSPIGYEDDLPDETVAGLDRVEKTGTIYNSPIEYQEQWGLLKTSAAPILGKDGKITSSAGADVNISVIQVATQNALFASALIGIGSILACIAVALLLVRRIAKPIGALTEDTLRIAAGDAHDPAEAPGPREVSDLRGALASLARKMTGNARDRDNAFVRQESEAAYKLLSAETGQHPGEPVRLVDITGLLVFWIAAQTDTSRSVLAHRAMTRLAERISDDGSIAANWRELADLDHGTCVVIDTTKGTVEIGGAGNPAISIGGTPADLADGSSAQVSAGQSVTLSRDGGETVLWRGEAQ